MIIRELITKLGFSVDEKGADTYERVVGKIKKAAAAIGVSMLVKSIFSSASEAEQMTLQLEALTGSAEKAKRVMAELDELGKKAPFNTDELSMFAQSLINSGTAAEKAVPLLEQFGNIAAGVGKDKLGTLIAYFNRAQTRGTASIMELSQIARTGVPIFQALADALGVSQDQVKTLAKEGKITANTLERAFISLGSGAFAGQLERLSFTLGGMTAQLSNRIKILKTTIGTELLPQARTLMWLFLQGFEKVEALLQGGVVKALKWILNAMGIAVALFVLIWRRTQGFLKLRQVVGELFTWLLSRIQKIVQVLGGWDKIFLFIGSTVYVIYTIIMGTLKLLWKLRDIILILVVLWKTYQAAIVAIAVTTKLIGALTKAWAFIVMGVTKAAKAAQLIWAAMLLTWKAIVFVAKGFRAVLALINTLAWANPFGALLVAIIAIAAMCLLVYLYWDQIGTIVGNIADWALKKWSDFFAWFFSKFKGLEEALIQLGILTRTEEGGYATGDRKEYNELAESVQRYNEGLAQAQKEGGFFAALEFAKGFKAQEAARNTTSITINNEITVPEGTTQAQKTAINQQVMQQSKATFEALLKKAVEENPRNGN